MTQASLRITARSSDTGQIVLPAVGTAWAPFAKQAIVTVLIGGAAVASTALPLLLITDAQRMWQGVAVAVGLLAITAVMAARPSLERLQMFVALIDFVAIGLLRFGTGDNQSVFLAITVLPLIWIAAGVGRWRIMVPLGGVIVTLLLPLVLSVGRSLMVSEFVRLLVVVLVYGAASVVVNELSRRSLRQLTTSQQRRRVAEAEVTQAVLVQRSLQPVDGSDLPPAFQVTGVCVPARAVGGDFYDWYPTPDGGAAVTLGDVMGKGVGAGMIAAAVRAVVRSSRDNPDPAAALRSAAAGISTGPGTATSGQFTTCFHARISPDGVLCWVDAGHGLTVLRRAAGEVSFLQSGHLPIGVGTGWASAETILGPGDSIVSVSDGVLDLFGGDLRSLDDYAAFVAERPSITEIVEELTALAQQQEQPDDVTVLAMAWSAAPS
ncbi:PP2C family protein-serine/threonine phosphatase [Curtobacterium sp. ME26]|uniref:PP2C family protein-serine/threonine phosphatase n=1 Tax=Curtobacterium sp. ME26 TaxID=2744254 RepID=UPI0015F39325|nr:SpoIIE family protein phosphatase [Curtobacterium sp. ME26]